MQINSINICYNYVLNFNVKHCLKSEYIPWGKIRMKEFTIGHIWWLKQNETYTYTKEKQGSQDYLAWKCEEIK